MTTTSIRASDAERDQVTRVLERAVADGRLTTEEGGERLAAASAARYRDELARLIRDLPAIVETPQAAAAPRVVPWLWIGIRLIRGVAFAALLLAMAFWGIGVFLPFWIAAFVGFAFVFGGARRRWHRAVRWRARGWYGVRGNSLSWRA